MVPHGRRCRRSGLRVRPLLFVGRPSGYQGAGTRASASGLGRQSPSRAQAPPAAALATKPAINAQAEAPAQDRAGATGETSGEHESCECPAGQGPDRPAAAGAPRQLSSNAIKPYPVSRGTAAEGDASGGAVGAAHARAAAPHWAQTAPGAVPDMTPPSRKAAKAMKRSKKDYAFWAGATAESRAAASLAYQRAGSDFEGDAADRRPDAEQSVPAGAALAGGTPDGGRLSSTCPARYENDEHSSINVMVMSGSHA